MNQTTSAEYSTRFRFGKIFAALFVLGMIASSFGASQSHADVRFVNLSNKTVYIAKYTHQPYRSSISAGEYNLPAEQPEGWTFSGWWKVYPGQSKKFKPGNYYVEKENRLVSWSGTNRSVGKQVTYDSREIFGPFRRKSAVHGFVL